MTQSGHLCRVYWPSVQSCKDWLFHKFPHPVQMRQAFDGRPARHLVAFFVVVFAACNFATPAREQADRYYLWRTADRFFCDAARTGGQPQCMRTKEAMRQNTGHEQTDCSASRTARIHGTAATTITSTSIPGRQKSVVRQARAGGFAGSTHSFQTKL